MTNEAAAVVLVVQQQNLHCVVSTSKRSSKVSQLIAPAYRSARSREAAPSRLWMRVQRGNKNEIKTILTRPTSLEMFKKMPIDNCLREGVGTGK